MPLLDYAKWSNFHNVIKKAIVSCETAENEASEHFAEVGKTIDMPKGAHKTVVDYMLTRYACYLIAQNGDGRPLADYLPGVTIAAKNLATEMTNVNVERKDLYGETSITTEHVQNNLSVREMLGERGIIPEELPPDEDIKKMERRVKREEKALAKSSGKLPE